MADTPDVGNRPGWDRPVQLIRPIGEHSGLATCPEGIAALREISGPAMLISVVGTQRTGKSTLLNLLHARKTSGFGLGHYLDAQTQGLWVWFRKHPRNPDATMILMDTEGLDTPHVSMSYNWTLSAFALLISQFFLYQSKGAIESSAVDRLGAMLTVADHLRGGLDDRDTDKPAFLWLIRDHQLAMHLTPQKEMEAKMDASSLSALNRCFRAHECMLLPRPVEKDSMLKEVESMTFSQLTEEFKEEYAVLERHIFQQVQTPVTMAGQTVTGASLSDLVTKYAEAISGDLGYLKELSQLPTQRQMVARMAGERAVRAGLSKYHQTMAPTKQKLPVANSCIAIAHAAAVSAAETAFRENAGLYGDDSNCFLSELRQRLDGWSPALISAPTNVTALPQQSTKDEFAVEDRDDIGAGQNSATDGGCSVQQISVSTGGELGLIWSANREKSRDACEQAVNNAYEPVASATNRTIMKVSRANSDGDDSATATNDVDGDPKIDSVEDFDAALKEMFDGLHQQSDALGSELNDVLTKASHSKWYSDRNRLVAAFASAVAMEQVDALRTHTEERLAASTAALEAVLARVESLEKRAQKADDEAEAQRQRAEELAKKLRESESRVIALIDDAEKSAIAHANDGDKVLESSLASMSVRLDDEFAKAQDERAALAQRVDTIAEENNASHSSMILRIDETVSGVESVRTALEVEGATMASRCGELDAKLSASLSELNTDLTGRVAEAVGDNAKRTEELSVSLTRRLDEVSVVADRADVTSAANATAHSQLSTDLNTARADAEQRFGTLKSEYTEAIKETKANVKEKIKGSESRTSAHMRQVYEMLEKQIQAMGGGASPEVVADLALAKTTLATAMGDLATLKKSTEESISTTTEKHSQLAARVDAIIGLPDGWDPEQSVAVPSGVSLVALDERTESLKVEQKEQSKSVQAFWQIVSDVATKSLSMEERVEKLEGPLTKDKKGIFGGKKKDKNSAGAGGSGGSPAVHGRASSVL